MSQKSIRTLPLIGNSHGCDELAFVGFTTGINHFWQIPFTVHSFDSHMKKVVYSFFIAFCLLSVAEAAKKKPTYFNVYEELQGSWMATQMTVSITTGAPIGSSEQKMYNITQNVVPQELLISEVDVSTKEEIRKPFQTILSVSSNFTAAINRFEPGADVEMTKKYDIHFREFLTQEVFVWMCRIVFL